MAFKVQIEREHGEKAALEGRLREKNRELLDLQARYEAHAAELNAK